MSADSDVDYDAISFAISSKYREVTVGALTAHPATPSALADQTGEDIAHVSRALQELREEGIVELLVDEKRKKGRLYGLTDEGDQLADELDGWGDE